MATQSSSASIGNAPTIVEILTTKRNPEIWVNYHMCRLSDGSVKAQCKRCGKMLNKESNKTLKLHTEKHCKGLRRDPEEGQASMSRDGTIFAYSEERCREALAKFVIQDALPFNHFDNPRLTKVIQNTLQPLYNQVSRSTLKRDCMKMWKTAKQDLVTCFENLNTSVNLTTDVWSAPHGLPGYYLCVTAHWVDPNTWQMMKRTIAFENFEYPLTGQALFYMLVNVMAYFKIDQKVFAISFDNASNNTNAVERLERKYNPPCHGIFYHGRCVAHILNLVVQSGLSVEEINDVKTNFQKMLQDVFYRGRARYKNYMRLCKETDSIFLTPNWDVPTRWDSTYNMFKRALRQRTTLKHFHDELFRKGRVTTTFTDASWDLIQQITDLLVVFKDVTTLLSGVYYPTSNLVLYKIWEICEKLKDFEFRGDAFETMLDAMKNKLKIYFKDMPPVFTCAAALNPCLNIVGVELLLEKTSINLGLIDKEPFYATQAKETFNQQFKELFMAYFQKYGSTNTCSSSDVSFYSTQASRNNKMSLYNMVRQANAKRARGDGSSSNTTEFGMYTGTNFLETLGYDEFTQLDILAWWKARESQFPVLAIMARDLLSVQASTVASESAFSLNGRVLSIRRTRLTPASLEMCICLKDHLDAMQRTQNTSTLEDALDFEQDIHNIEVEEGESISLSDEEIQLDESMRANSEEDQE